jgi:hypothetical protein
MGKGGGGSSTQTVVNRPPEEVMPFLLDVLKQGRELTGQEYTPYGGQRLADTSPDVMASDQMVRNVAQRGIPGLDTAMGMTMDSASKIGGVTGGGQGYDFSKYGGFKESEFSPSGDISETQFKPAAEFSQFDFQGPEKFTGETVGQYMSPYMQQVADIQKQQAMENFQTQAGQRAANAVQSGAFGGSRQGVVEATAQKDLMSQMAEIDATSRQKAYEDAQGAFESDRAAQEQFQQNKYNEQYKREMAQAEEFARAGDQVAAERARVQAAQTAELARVQAGAAGEASRVQAGEAGEESRVQAAQADENMRQRQFMLEGLGMSSDMASQIAALGGQSRSADIESAQLMEAIGLRQQGDVQKGLDLAYQDFINQRDWGKNQLADYVNIVYGNPLGGGDFGATTSPGPNPYSQALGGGISMLGLSRAYG